jgi:hypothetical protein
VKNKKRNAISLSRRRACRSDAPTLALVTLAGLEPATSPALPQNKDALSPLELQRRHDLYDRLWRRKGGLPGYFSILIVRVVVAPQSSQV